MYCKNILERPNLDFEELGYSNIVSCKNCKLEYCWLCLKPYSKFHFKLYNIFGCPGRKYENLTNLSKWNQKSFLFIFYMFVVFYTIFLSIYKIVFYTLFGYPYAFTKRYKSLSKEVSLSKSIFHHLVLIFIGLLIQVFFWPQFISYCLSYDGVDNSTIKNYTLLKYIYDFFNCTSSRWKEPQGLSKICNCTFLILKI